MNAEMEIRPKYLPRIGDEKAPSVRDGTIETLAFILSGVDPSERVNPERVHLSLRQLIADPTVKRIGSSTLLRDDHEAILSPRFDFNEVDFEDVWRDAKDVPTGQGSTELLKLSKQLQRLELDPAGIELRSPKNAETVKLLHTFAHKLLHRIYRTAIRHIEEISKRPMPAVAEPWYGSLLERVKLRRAKVSTAVSVDDEIFAEASQYLDGVMKIGRVLRVPVRKT